MASVLPDTASDGKALTDAWDYKGRPASRATTGGWACAAMILGVELFERMTTLGIAVNLVPYMTGTMHLGNASAANTVTNFIGASFMLCLLGGFVADTYLGRYLTIAVFTAVQATGVMILTISTAAPGLRPPPCGDARGASADCVPATGTQLGVLYLGLYLTALGTGGLKSSVSGFGSDQFDESHDGERSKMLRFFNWFYFFVSIGALLAVTALVYVQDNVGRRWGYGVCAVGILCGLAVFLLGTRRYRFKKLVGSPLTQVAAVTAAAWTKRRLPLPSDPDLLYDVDAALAAGADVKGKEKLPHSKECRFLDHAAIIDGTGGDSAASKWALCTRTDVEEVKQVVRMLPIWATTIMFWTIHAQMTTFSVAQAEVMDRAIGGSSGFHIPAGSLTVFLIGSILLTVPVYDRLVAPLARRVTGNPHGLTPLQRVFVGLFLSVAGMAVAALVERHRQTAASAEHGVTLSVFLLMPQFVLVGAGEAFTYMGQLAFFLRECPKGMKTMSTGLFLSTCALGFFFSTLLVTIVHKVTGRHGGSGGWLADNLDDGRLDYFYWLLAVISAINLVIFTFAARGYVYKEKRLADAGIELADEESIAVGH
ncbi:hypothetical protein BDA96_01G295000 [Sorghum bicolor]|uniref:Uncharacterized protein n=1 Tax=Sorghum bicolor TaxID=4558 RepID=A0A921V1R4_SORBI|nr:hypothetical protein BDA96_01G295000 [Sorghum bicolor]